MTPQGHDGRLFAVLGLRNLTEFAYVIRIERRAFGFQAGQHMGLGLPGGGETREYSVYSAEQDPFLELLIKEVPEGSLSMLFRKLRAGDRVHLNEPVGSFVIAPELRRSARFVFVASGTGIAPFHSFARSYPGLDYRLLHGVRGPAEAYERQDYERSRHVLCSSREPGGDFAGRVTDFLRANPVDPRALYYLCGNYKMIDEVYSLLAGGGVAADNIRSEVYFHF